MSGHGGDLGESLWKEERTWAKANPTLLTLQEFSAEWIMEHITINSKLITEVGVFLSYSEDPLCIVIHSLVEEGV